MSRIDAYKQNLGFGTRLNKFVLKINENDTTTTNTISIMCHKATFPKTRDISSVTQYFHGQPFTIAMDRSEYTSITLSYYEPDNFQLYNYFKDWMNSIVVIKRDENNIIGDNYIYSPPDKYKKNGNVQIADQTSYIEGGSGDMIGIILKTFQIFGMYPTSIGGYSDLDVKTYDVPEITISFAIDYYEEIQSQSVSTSNVGTTTSGLA